MTSDPNKKTTRTFQCREALWQKFEQMARELECSVDYLINEAMKQYARQRSYGQQRTPYPPNAGREAGHPGGASSSGFPPPSPGAGMRGGPLPPPPRGGRPTSAPLPSPPAGRGGGMGLPPPPARGGMGLGPPPSRTAPPGAGPRSVPPPLPRGGPPMGGGGMGGGGMGGMNGYPQTHGSVGQLSVVYQGDKLPINKDRFVIGRGKQSSDLTLKDPNVSRQHAMIEFQNGVYFMVDMGSTNGVEYNGQRIARKQIAEGDVFRICDHDLRFTYR